MEPTHSTEPPLACTLGAGDFKERLTWISEINRQALLNVRRRGRQLVLAYQSDYADDIREMMRREQECCAFLDFALSESDSEATLVITAPEIAADALDAVFEPFLGNSGSGRCTCGGGRKEEDNDSC